MSNIMSSSLHASERGLDPLTGDALPLYRPVRIYSIYVKHTSAGGHSLL